MKTRFLTKRLKSSIASTAVLALIAGGVAQVSAATVTSWNKADGTFDWNTAGNWDNGVPGAGDTANLTAALTANGTANLSDNATVGILNISSTGGTFLLNLTATAGKTLTMDNGGSQAQINIGTTGNTNNTVINVPIRMTSGGLLITSNNTAARTVKGGISSGVAGNQTLVLRALNTGNLIIDGNITNGSGTVGVVVDNSGGGQVRLQGNGNTFSGGILVQNGTLGGHSNMGTGLITLGSASTTTTVQIAVVPGKTISNNILVSSANAKDVRLMYQNGDATTTLAGDIELQKDAIVYSQSGSINLTLSGKLSGSGTLKLDNTVASSDSTYILSGDNSAHSGGINLNPSSATGASTLVLGHANALGTGTLTIQGSGTSKLDTNGSDVALTTSNAIDLNADITYVGTDGKNLTFGTGITTLSANRTITVQDGTLGFNGVIQGSRTLTKDGAGALALNNVNTYTGETSIEAGTLRGIGSIAGDLWINDHAILEGGIGGDGAFTVAGDIGILDNAVYKLTLNSTSGTYGQLIANGSAISLDDDSVFAWSDLGADTWTGGDITVIKNNTGLAFVGMFSNIGEGDTVTIGSNNFIATYLGNGGNDFVLMIPEPGVFVLFVLGIGILLFKRRYALHA